MKIVKVEAIPVIIPFNTEWKISTVNDFGGGYVVMKLYTDEGIVGIGEIGRWFEGECPSDIVNTCMKFCAPILMEAEDPLNINAIMDKFRCIRERRFAKALVDIALHDLKGKKLGIPVYQLLGGAYRTKIPVCQSLGIKDYDSIRRDLDLYLGQGFRAFKIKIGLDYDFDIKLVRMIREIVGPDVQLRVDANGAYFGSTCLAALQEMEKCNLTLIEQPCSYIHHSLLRDLRRSLHTPILACEAAMTPETVYELVKDEAVDMINIKIGRPSGFIGSKQMEAVAIGAGLPVCVGTQLEMGVGTAACAHLAASIRDFADTSDITGPTLLVDDILIKPLDYRDGYLHVPNGPGLGVEIDDDKLEFYRLDK